MRPQSQAIRTRNAAADAQTDRKPAATMIEIRTCEGFDEMQACVSSRSRPGAMTKATSFRARLSCWRKKSAARSSAHLTANCRQPQIGLKNSGWLRHVFAGDQANPERRLSLTSTRTCWRSGHRIAIAALASNSNGNNAVRRFLAAFATWSGPSIRSSYQECFPQYPQTGSHLPRVSCGFLWCILISSAGWAANRPAFGGMGAGFPSS